MHEKLMACRIPVCPTKDSLKGSDIDFIKLKSNDMFWLFSLYNDRKGRKPLEEPIIISCDYVTTGQTYYYFVRQIDKAIQVDCYLDEKQVSNPVCTIVARECILGSEWYSWGIGEGEEAKESVKSVLRTVFSIISYMNIYKEQAIHSTKKVKGKIKHIYNVRRPLGYLPKSVLFDNNVYSVNAIEQKQSSINHIQNGLQLEVNGDENSEWILHFAEKVHETTLQQYANNDEGKGFTCWKNDIYNPHMLGIKIYSEKLKVQMHVSKLSKGVFQVNCYDDKNDECNISLIADFNNPLFTTCEIIYLSEKKGYVEKNIIDKAEDLVMRFRACMMYNRICSWEDVEAGDVHEVLPITIFGEAI